MVAAYLDAPVRDVTSHWPNDVVEVVVRSLLQSDEHSLQRPSGPGTAIRLLGPFDLFLQGKDRELIIPDADRRKVVWRTLGRPGAIMSGHEIVGTWRPKSLGKRLQLVVDRWEAIDDDDLIREAERLADHRSQSFGGFLTDVG